MMTMTTTRQTAFEPPRSHTNALLSRAVMLVLLGGLTGLGSMALAPTTARAQQPLEEFLRASENAALDMQEAQATERQADAALGETRGRLLPSVLAQGGYRRNQYESEFTNPITRTTTVLQARDALNVTFQLNVPVFNAGYWALFFQRVALADAAGAQRRAVEQSVRSNVVQGWYQLVAARAMTEAAQRNLEVLQKNLTATKARLEVGAAPQLDLSRAEAELARAEQGLVDARLQATLLARRLEDLTGLKPNDTRQPLTADLTPEKALETYVGRAAEQPSVQAARAQHRAAAIASDMAWTVFLPVINASASETGTNAAGLAGHKWAYALGVNATWQLDFAQPALMAQAKAAADLAAIRTERARQQITTALFESWQRVETSRAAVVSAQAAVKASRRAAEDARARYDAGAATQLDLIQAEREAFQADVGLIQAQATLEIWRRVLRIQSGLVTGNKP